MQMTKERLKALKPTLLMAGIGVVVLLAFGLFGREGDVTFEISRRTDVLQIPSLSIDSQLLGVLSGVIMLTLAGLGFYARKKTGKSSLWVISLFSALAIIALLGWLATGNSVPLAFIIGTSIVYAAPLMLGAMSGIMSERVGVTNIAIEGQFIGGAFVAAVIATITGSYSLAMISAMVAGMLISSVLALFAVKYLAQQIIVGVVLNVLVVGITNFLYQQWLTKDAENVNFPGTMEIISIPLLSDIPILGPVFFENRITVFLALLGIPALWFLLFRTKLGLRARAVGEHPLAADTVGINVRRTRVMWVTFGGAFAGLGGAALTIGGGGAFGREMSAGLGFIALAVVILGKWNPIYAGLAALLFGFSIILRIWSNQVSPGIPTDFIAILPYVVTVLAVAGFVGKSRPPKALAIPYVKG